jgi:outer membrane assembly lipoprotein YfiO
VAYISHFESGRQYFYQGKIKEARVEFREALRLNPRLDEIDKQLAAESAEYLKKIKEKERHVASLQYTRAKGYEAGGNFIGAANAYRELIEQYPDSKEVASALDGLYRTASRILEEGGKRRLFGESNYSRARRFFKFLSERLPFGEKAARVEYKIGLSYFHDGDFPKARLHYRRVIENYPRSAHVEKALFGIATTYLIQSTAPPRDQTMARRAREEFKNFGRLFPDSPLQKDAKEKLNLLNKQLAEHLYRIGTFYMKQGEPAAAKIYYESILKDYPETPQAALARSRLNELTTNTAIY